jgi:hypothetical protein
MSRLVWVRSEAFDHGVFNTSVRWTVPKVLDFLGSLRIVVPSMNISFAMWVDAATTKCKPALTEAEATAYWHVFSVLSHHIIGLPGDQQDVRRIGLILMCQVFSPHRVRADQFVKSGEMFPGNQRSGRLSPRCTSPRAGHSSQAPTVSRDREASAAMLAFVRDHIGSFLQVACFALTSEPASVSSDEFDILGLILSAGSSMAQPLKRASEGIPELATKRTLPMKELRKLFDKSLVWNEEVYPAVEPTPHTISGMAPETGSAKTVNLSGLSKTTWFQSPKDTDIRFLNISGCTDCTVYVTSPVHFCLVSGCHDCNIVLSSVSALCTINHCEKISVHVAAHCFKMENSTDSSAFLFCHIPPILTGDTRGIKLAPFNVLSSSLAAALRAGNMQLQPEYVDVWAHPVCCALGSLNETTSIRSGLPDEPSNTVYHFVHPASFQPVVVPGLPARGAASAALCLPQVYDDAFKSREEEMRALQRSLAQLGDEAKRKRVQQTIQGHFREWLQSTGKSRQLADLARMSLPEK